MRLFLQGLRGMRCLADPQLPPLYPCRKKSAKSNAAHAPSPALKLQIFKGVFIFLEGRKLKPSPFPWGGGY